RAVGVGNDPGSHTDTGQPVIDRITDLIQRRVLGYRDLVRRAGSADADGQLTGRIASGDAIGLNLGGDLRGRRQVVDLEHIRTLGDVGGIGLQRNAGNPLLR